LDEAFRGRTLERRNMDISAQMTDFLEQSVIVRIEPSRRLSELCGFPYFIEKRFLVKELLEKGVISEGDVKEMGQGKEIYKKIRLEGCDDRTR